MKNEFDDENQNENYETDDYTFVNYNITPDDNDEGEEIDENEEEPTDETTSEIIEEEVRGQLKANVKQEAGKKAEQTIMKVLLTNPYFWIIIGCMAIVILVPILVSMFAFNPFENTDVNNGKFDTSAGISGDKFYGARLVYFDEEKKVVDLQKNYENLAVDYLTNIDKVAGIDLIISLEYTETPSAISDMILIISKAVNNSNDELSVEQSLKLVEYFGYTTEDLIELSSTLPEYINKNRESLLVIDDAIYTGDLTNDLSLLFSTSYSNLNTTSSALYVEDIILGEEGMISGLPQRKYVAMIYMAKEEVRLEDISLMMYIPENTNNDSVEINFAKYNYGELDVIYSATADMSWWADEEADNVAEYEGLNYTLMPFTAIDNTNLTQLNGSSIYSLITTNGVKLDVSKAQNYFKISENSTQNNNEVSTNISYLPNEASNAFIYNFNSTGSFQFAEYNIAYE